MPSEVLADEQAARRLAGPSRASLQLVRAKEARAATANLPTAHLLSGSSLVVGNGPNTQPGDLPSVRLTIVSCIGSTNFGNFVSFRSLQLPTHSFHSCGKMYARVAPRINSCVCFTVLTLQLHSSGESALSTADRLRGAAEALLAQVLYWLGDYMYFQ